MVVVATCSDAESLSFDTKENFYILDSFCNNIKNELSVVAINSYINDC